MNLKSYIAYRISLISFFVTAALCYLILSPPPVNASTRLTPYSITTSGTNGNASALYDQNPSTTFNLGGTAPQWLQLDLNTPQTVSRIVLNPDQSPASGYRTSHTISFYTGYTDPIFSVTVDKYTADNNPIELALPSPLANIRFIRITSNRSNSWISWRDIDVYIGTTKESSLRYFGYYGLIDGNWVNYFHEVTPLGNSNIGIAYGYPDPTRMRQVLTYFRESNLKAFVMPREIFFANLGTIGTNTKANLYSDWPARWAAFKVVLDEFPDVVHGFYFDEALTSTIIYTSDFLSMTGQINSSYPNKPILLVEAITRLQNNTMPADYYQYVTDIGFDYYFTTWATDNDAGWSTYLDTFYKLLTLAPGRRVWLIPDGIAKDSSEATRWPDAYEKYLGLALTTPNAVGILNFIWHSLSPAEPYPVTLRSALIPSSSLYNINLRQRHIQTGQAIIAPPPSTSPSPSPSSIPGDFSGDGKVNGIDYTILSTNFGTKYTVLDYADLLANYRK